MKKSFVILGAALALASCSTTHYVASKDNRPGKLMAKGFTHSGCVENLKERAEELDIHIELQRVTSSMLSIFRYKCYGVATDKDSAY